MVHKDRDTDGILSRHVKEAMARKPPLLVPAHRSHLPRAVREAESRRRQVERKD